MTMQAVWSCSVNAHRALGAVLRDGYGRFVYEWDSRVWHYWRHLEWDQRPSSELDTQPPEVDAYLLTPAEVCRLGLRLAEDVPCVLFILFDGPGDEATPLWAAVVGEAYIDAEDEDVVEDV